MAMTDNRIIQMQFDNEKFEKNIAQSQKSIEELKEAMDFEETSRGLKRFSHGLDGLDFSGMIGNLQRLTDKFTGLGNVGEYVVSRIRNTFEGLARDVEGLIRSLSIDQITVGQGKYDALNKSIQTIVADGKTSEAEAYEVMERVMAYTDQTSHNYSTMVGQISALRSSTGMGLQEAERFLEGIGNASTMAGAGAQEAAMAMSLIGKVMGGTHLGRQQFDSLNQTYRVISSKWRELAIEAGVTTGDLVKKGEKIFTAPKYGKQIEVTASQLENTLAKRWFTGDVAKELYKNFYFGETIEELQHPEEVIDSFGKTAYLTGQRALTFADALNAIKESVSSGWLDTFRIVLGDLTEAVQLFTDVCDRVVETLEPIKEFRNDVLKSWKTGGGRNSLLDILLGDYWRDTETGAVGFMDLLDGLGDMVYTGFRDFLLIFADPVDRYEAMKNPEYFKAWIGARLADITQGVENFMQRIKAFFNEEVDVNGETKTRLQIVYEIVQGISGALAIAWMVMEGILHFIDKIRAQLQPAIDTVSGFFGSLGISIYNTAETASDQKTIFTFFDELAAKFEPVTNAVNHIVEALDKLLRTILGLDEGATGTEVIESLGNALLTVADWISKGAAPIIDFIADILEAIADLSSGKIDFSGFLERLGGAFTGMFDTYMSYLPEDLLPDWLKSLFGIGEDSTEKEGQPFFDKLKTFFETNFGSFDTLLSKLTQGFSLKNALESGFGFLSAFNFLGTVIGWFKGTNLYNVILAFLGAASLVALWRLIAQAKKAVRTIGGFFDDVGGNLKAGVIGQYEWNSEKILNFAKGILMIAGAIALLGCMDRGALIQGVIAVGLIFAALMAFIAIVGSEKFKANYGQQLAAAAVIDAIAAAVVAIVVSLSVLMLAMIPLASDWRKMLAAFLGFTGILTVIGGFIVIMLNAMNALIGPGVGGKVNWAGIGKVVIMLVLLGAMVAAISLSIGALMLAMAPLALTGWKNILAVTVSFGLILTAIGAFIVIMLNALDKFTFSVGGGSQWAGIGKMAIMMLSLAATVAIIAVGVGVLVTALAPLAAMSPQSIITAVAALGLILTEIGLFIVIMLNQMDNFAFNVGGGKTGPAGLAKMAAMMGILAIGVTLLSASIALLILAITPLAMMSAEGVIKAVGGLGVILLELGLFMNYLNKVNDGNGASVKILSFAGFAFSIGILILALSPLALMDWAGWGRAMLGLGIVLGELIGAMYLAKRARVKTSSLTAFAGFAVSIGILIFSLQPLAGMDWAAWGRAMLGLGIVLGELIGAMWLMDKAHVNTIALTSFIGFALSIAILIFALKPLADMDQDGYYRAIFGLGTVMLELVVLMAIMNELKPNLATAGSVLLMLVGLGASMILFGIAFNEIKDVPVENIIGFAAAISILMVAIAGAAALAKIGGIAGMVIAIAGFAALMGVISLLAPMLIGSVAKAFREAAGDFAIVADLLSTFSSKMDGVNESQFNKANRVVDLVMGLIGKMIGITFTNSTTRGFMSAMSRLTLAADEMIKFDKRIKSVSADGGVSNAISLVDGYKTLIEDYIVGFDKYLTSAQGFYSVLFNLGSAFDYFDSMTQNAGEPDDNSRFGMIKQLAACAPDLDTIYKMDLNKFKRQLAELGGAMIVYAKGAASVNGEEITDDTDIGGAIILLRKIGESLSQEGGFTIPDNMPEEKEITDFGVEIAALAGALVAFEDAGKGLGTGTTQALRTLDFFSDLKTKLISMSLGKDLNSAINGLKDEDGNFINQDELTIFAEDIAKLGSSMAHFASSTQVLDEETGEMKPIDYTMATDALDSIGRLVKSLPRTGGWAQIVLGRKKGLDDLATELNLLGDAMGEFHTSTSTFDEGQKKAVPMDFTNAIDFLNSVGDVQTKLPKVKSFSLQKIFESDQMSLGDLGSEIAQLGSGLGIFAEKVTGTDENGNKKFDPDVVAPAITAVDSMVTFMQTLSDKLPTVGGLANILNTVWNGRDVTLKDLGDQVGYLGDGLGKLGEGLNKGKWNEVTGATYAFEAVESILGIMLKLETLSGMTGSAYANLDKLTYFIEGLNRMNSYQDGIEHNSVVDSIVEFMDKMNTAFIMLEDDEGNLNMVKDRFEMFKLFAEGINQLTNSNLDISWAYIGTNLITDVAAAISGGVTSVVDALHTVLSAVNTEGETHPGIDWTKIGSYIDSGITKGISDGEDGVTVAARKIARAAYNAAMKELDASSPSKVFMDVGSYIGLGMAKGIDGSTGDVINSATGMSDEAIQTAGTLMAAISQTMAESTDAQPTITPVLDLSLVESGLREFGLTGYGGTIGINTAASSKRAGRIGQVSGDENQNGTNYSGIYDRMAVLGDQIQALGKSIANMKLVLNTGVVAGGVTDGVDANLGRKIFYANRKN